MPAHDGGTAQVLRPADDEGALVVAGQRPDARVRDRVLARGDLDPSRGPEEVRRAPELSAGDDPMKRRTVVMAQLLFVLALVAAPSFAADDEALKKDLTAVIALQGLP